MQEKIRVINNIKENLGLAKDLYKMSVALEVYYSKNINQEYIEQIAERTRLYIKDIDNKIKTECVKLMTTIKRVSKYGERDFKYIEFDGYVKDIDNNLVKDKEYLEFNRLLQLPTEFYVLPDHSVVRKRIEAVA